MATSYDVPPVDRASRRARDRRLRTPLWWRRACGIAGWCSLFAVVGLWFWGGGARELTQLGTGLNSVGRLTGVLPHQPWIGRDFLTSTVATAFWWSLWAAAAGSVLIWRVGQPVGRSLRHRLVVHEVRPENDQVTTIVMRGRKLDRLPGTGCQGATAGCPSMPPTSVTPRRCA